jgi:16S rRNA (adenine1518-N6/adenine1519-N6)-dimethyltransferase
MKAIKSLGQNFLKCSEAVNLLTSNILGENILEIGPGTGALTKNLVNTQKDYLGIEIDQRCVTFLQKEIPEAKILNLNFLNTEESLINKKTSIVSSLPYYLTSPIIHKIIFQAELPIECKFLVQYEVAKKITEQEPNNAYLATFINSFYKSKLVKKVKRECFEPIPKVESAIIQLTLRETQIIPHNLKHKYKKFLHHGYRNRRKKIKKSLELNLLETCKIDPNVRPQNISTKEWQNLFFNYLDTLDK